MSDWNPSRIYMRADSIVGHARTIEYKLWHVSRYKVDKSKRDEFADDLTEDIKSLRKAINDFKELDTDKILDDLTRDAERFQRGLL